MKAFDQGRRDFRQDKEPQGNVQQSEPYHDQAHNGTCTERDLKAAIETFFCSLGRSVTGHSCGFHTEETT